MKAAVLTLVAGMILALAPALTQSPLAAEPADRDIAAALADIERFEQEFAGLTEARTTNVKRTKRLLEISRERLEGSANRDHPSWAEADRRLVALIAHLDALLGGGGATAAPSTASPKTAAPAVSAPSPASTAQMISQDRARLARLNRDIESAIATLDEGGPKPFQDPAYAAQRQAVLDKLRQALERFAAFPEDAEVIAAGAALERLEAMMELGRSHAAAELAELGDAQAALAAANRRLGATALPETPTPPYAQGEVRGWLVALAESRRAAAADATALEPFKARAYLPLTRGTPEQGAAYDMQDLQRLQAGFVDHVRAIDQAFAQFTADLDLQIAHVADDLAYIDGLDPEDPHDQANALLGEGQAAEMQARLAAIEGLVATAVDFDQSLGRESDRAALLARVRAAAAAYAAKRERALEVVRMPEAASTDPALIEIAEATLANPDYAVGPIARLVVNVDRRSYEMETSEVEIDRIDMGLGGSLTASGTETTYRYAWDQFQVATAELVGERYFIYYTTLKFFTSGAPTTPLQRWIVAERLRTVEIPEANIALD